MLAAITTPPGRQFPSVTSRAAAWRLPRSAHFGDHAPHFQNRLLAYSRTGLPPGGKGWGLCPKLERYGYLEKTGDGKRGRSQRRPIFPMARISRGNESWGRTHGCATRGRHIQSAWDPRKRQDCGEVGRHRRSQDSGRQPGRMCSLTGWAARSGHGAPPQSRRPTGSGAEPRHRPSALRSNTALWGPIRGGGRAALWAAWWLSHDLQYRERRNTANDSRGPGTTMTQAPHLSFFHLYAGFLVKSGELRPTRASRASLGPPRTHRLTRADD